MSFILKMAWRDSRASRRRLLLLSLSVVFGIAALVAIGSVSANLRRAIDEQASGLLGADVIINGRIPATAEWAQAMAAPGVEVARERIMATPVAAAGATQRTQIRAIEGDFPFYGEFDVKPADALRRLRQGGNVAIVSAKLVEQLQVRVGDTVALGRARERFTVIGVVASYPGSPPQVNFAPAVAFIPFAALSPSLGLRANRLDLRLPRGLVAAEFVKGLKAGFPDSGLVIATADERRQQLDDGITGFDAFFHLVGFVALFLGAIGVASVVHVYVRQKIATVAILRCLGASGRQAFAIYLLQGFALGLFGAVVGAGLGLVGQGLMPALLKDLFPFPIHFFISWPAVASGMVSGLVICLLFTLLPLLTVRNVPPLAAFRSALAERASGVFDPWRVVIAVSIPVAVAGFAVWQTKSVRFGMGYAFALGFGFATLTGAAYLVSWAARVFFPSKMPYVVRQGVANLYRPQNRTVLLLLSIGLGAFLMIALFLTRSELMAQLQGPGGAGRPNLLLPVVEGDELEPVTKLLSDQGAPVVLQTPFVQMNLLSVNGKPPGRRWRLPGAKDTVLFATHRDHLNPNETVKEGKFAGTAEPGAAEVPIALSPALRRGVDPVLRLGDIMEWDVQGIPMRTRVTAVLAGSPQFQMAAGRRYEFIFPEGVINGAPASYSLGAHAATPALAAKAQRAVTAAFPQLEVVDLSAIFAVILRVFDKIAYVIGFMASFVIATGIVMLVSAILTGRFQRIRETVLLRTLGASHRQLVLIQLVEYAILGILATVVGAMLAVGGNLLLAHFVFKIPAAISPLFLLEATAAVTLVTLVTGWLANRGITNHPPLAVLRQET